MTREIISRPKDGTADELLVDHSKDVGERLPELCVFTDEGTPSAHDIAHCVGYLHDLGKATTYFQYHVREEYVEEKRLTYHSRLGAFAAFHALGQMGASENDRLVGFLAILRHHGRLPNAAEKIVNDTKAERDGKQGRSWVCQQVENIETNDQNRIVADSLFRDATGGAATWASFKQAMIDESLFDAMFDAAGERGPLPTLVDPDPDRIPAGTYDRTVRLWSALTLADKTSAAGIKDAHLHPTHLPLNRLERYIETLRVDANLNDPPPLSGETAAIPGDVTDTDALNQIRESVRRLVRTNAQSFVDSPLSVATLTLPTGLGKTFTGLTAAYTIRDELHHQGLNHETKPRVIYALPYTSIIEQTRSLFEDEDIFDADPRGSAFTVHHYLSETVTFPETKTDDSDDENGDQTTDDTEFFDCALLGESWRSGTVLTTFVQLFDSLTGPTNAAGLKLPALTDSVLILDEPQTLPKSWWGAIRRLTELLVEQYGVHVISMTATQPSLFTHAPTLDTCSLLAADESTTSVLEEACFEAVTRVEYSIDESIRNYGGSETPFVDYDTAGERLLSDAIDSSGNGSSVLAVCNTIASTMAVADATVAEAERTDVQVRRIGGVYREALAESTRRVSQDRENGIDWRPSPRIVAEETLRKLGLASTDSEDDRSLAEQDWIPDSEAKDQEVLVGTFTSRLRPRDRRALVTVANVLARASTPFVFVSTQAIEAGVDISFASVYRDLAPMDSIVQAAGRCNRSFEWGHSGGHVTVWALAPVDGTSDPPAAYVYRPREQLAEVASILTGCCTDHGMEALPETVMTREAVPEYFEWVDEADLSDPTLVEWIESCEGQSLGRAHLIDDEYEKRDIIVAETPAEKELLDRASEAFKVGNLPDGFDILTILTDLRVSVPVDDIETIRNRVYRLDHGEMTDNEGVTVLACTAAGDGKPYDIGDGGFIVDEDDGLAGRFTF